MRTVRGHPEADIQRAIVRDLRLVLPRGSILHHSANEERGGDAKARRRQGILRGMGVHPGFSDLILLQDGRVMFLEVKSKTGTLSPEQRGFRDAVVAQGFAWAVVRSSGEAIDALARFGFRTLIKGGL